MHRDVSASLVLLAAAAVALVWVNSPFGASYEHLWEEVVEVSAGSFHLELTLHELVNDALMAVFFFVVGLEIKRELVTGELRDLRAAAMPAFAAVGGMVVPASIYLASNAGTDAGNGWGIPMATDIAFALGVVALLGSRVPPTLKIFLLTLAIVDDIGGILVIAFFYTTDVAFTWLLAAVGGLVLVVVMQRLRVWWTPIYVVVGSFVWFATHESGVHATIAGVALGLLCPARPLLSRSVSPAPTNGSAPSAEDVRLAGIELREQVSVVERLESLLHPYTAFFIVPVFALSNAGIELSGDALAEASTASITLGVFLGLVVGKTVGVVAFTWLGTRLGLPMPRGASWSQVLGIGVAAGIGFTVALFIDGLAFDPGDPLLEQAKIGIFAASLVSAIGALLILRWAASPATVPSGPTHEVAREDRTPEPAIGA